MPQKRLTPENDSREILTQALMLDPALAIRRCQQPANRSPADPNLLRDLPLGHPLPEEFLDTVPCCPHCAGDRELSYYNRISLDLDPQTKARIDALFDKADGARQTPWDAVKNEPGEPTVKGVKRFLTSAKWLKEQTVDLTVLIGIPVVKLQRFAVEARGLNASRMKEAQPDKRYAFAVALIQRQRARALDDAADLLIRLVQRMHNTAKEKLLLLQSARLQQSGDLVAKLRDVGMAYLSDGSETERLQSIGLLLGPDVQELLQRCDEHVALAASNHFRLLPQCFSHPRQALLALLDNLPLSSTSQNRSVVDAGAFVLASQDVRAVNVSVAGSDQREPLDLGFVSDAWWPLVTGLKTRSTASLRIPVKRIAFPLRCDSFTGQSQVGNGGREKLRLFFQMEL